MLAKIKLSFERGGALILHLDDKAPETVRQVLAALPCENYVMHSRYCGREICFGIQTPSPPPKENNTCMVSKFDVSYWRDWESPPGSRLPGSAGEESLNLFYGPEQLTFQGRLMYGNIIGHVDFAQEALLDEIGLRIWQQGFENVKAEQLTTETEET